MADDTDAGLSVRQLLKMVASGDLRAVLYVFGKPDFHIWSRLREFGAHIPDPDLESFKTRLRDILNVGEGGVGKEWRRGRRHAVEDRDHSSVLRQGEGQASSWVGAGCDARATHLLGFDCGYLPCAS